MQFTQGLHRAVQLTPNATATICDGRRQSFSKLHDRVARLAAGLQNLGAIDGSRIAILSLNSDYYIEAYLAIAWAGAVTVPLNFRWSAAELQYAMQDAAVDLLLVDDHFADSVPNIIPPSSNLRHVVQLGAERPSATMIAGEMLIAKSSPIPDQNRGGDALLGVFYTGGTTGAPKGVMLSHTNLCSSALSMLAEGAFQEGGLGLHVAPMFHLADMLMLTCLLLRGNGHVVLSSFDPDELLATIAAERVSDTLLVPTMLQALVRCPSAPHHDVSSLKTILYGASPASEALIEAILARFPNVGLLQGYGMTESAALISALPPAAHRTSGSKKLRSAGRATYDTLVKIVAADGTEVEPHSIGEILVRGPNVMHGYLNKPDASAETLRNGWLHTGDMGYMDDDGFIFLVDRLKDMIISGGENVYSVEVENAIAKHPDVHSVSVIGIPCDQMGEKVHAVIILHMGRSLNLADLQSHCRRFIAGYKCPRSLSIVDQLPISGAGKILKTELRRPYWEQASRNVS